ncbi:MAG: DUF1579 domain-containing protein [Chthoniobacterales bacterium]
MHSQLGNGRRWINALLSLTISLAAALIPVPSFGQTTAASMAPSPHSASIPSDSPKLSGAQPASASAKPGAPATGQPNEAEMMKQMAELAKLNENHKLLASMAGTWSYIVKFWMAPGAPPSTSTGTAVRKAMMEGRYFTLDVTGKMQMPGPDGKMKDIEFKGLGIEGYDNVKKKFFGTWADNMGTGIMMSEGTYDPATKTFTYTGEYEPMPGMKTKVRETVKIIDNDHHTFEWYEDRGGQEAKTMEITYTRKK